MSLDHNDSVSLVVPHERQSSARLSVIEEQDSRRRQEFAVHVRNESVMTQVMIACFRSTIM